MGKSKSEKKNKAEDNGSQHGDFLGMDVKSIGAAVASILVSEIVEAAVQRFSHPYSDSNQDTVGSNHNNAFRDVAARVKDEAQHVGASAKDATDDLRTSAANVTLNLSEVVDVLRDAGQRLKQKSTGNLTPSADAVISTVSSGATAVLDRVLPNTKKSKKSKKKKKN
jgi:hypothetical protein